MSAFDPPKDDATCTTDPEAAATQLRAELYEQLRESDLKPERSGQEFRSLCPAHNDHEPSLSSTVKFGGDGRPRLLMHCHAGCSFEDVSRTSGISLRSLRIGLGTRPVYSGAAAVPVLETPSAPISPPSLPTEEQLREWAQALLGSELAKRLGDDRGWAPLSMIALGLGVDDEGRIAIPIRDGNGNLLSVERYAPDAPADAPKLIAAKGRPRHLFRPPIDLASGLVLLLEGPSDAIAAHSRGLLAVAAPSASIWKAAYALALRDAGVKRAIIIGDCDTAGRRFAPRVARSLIAHGLAVETVDLDPSRDDGFDLTDWLKSQSGTADDLQAQLIELAEPYAPKAPKAEDAVTGTEFELLRPRLANARPTEFVWRNRLVRGLVNLLVGEEGAGKGTLIAWVIAKLTCGELDGDLRGIPARVLIIGDEDDFDRVWTPRLHVAGADLDMIGAVKGNSGATLTFPSGLPKLRELISTFGADLVFCDQLIDNLDPEINPDAAKDVRRALMPLRVLAGETGICVVAALHTNKARGGSFRQSVSGSHAFNAISRSSLLVAPHPDGPEEKRVLAHGKGSYVRRAMSQEFTIESRSPKIGDHVIQTSVAVDFKDCPLSADDLLAPKKTEPTSKSGRAREYIREALADGQTHDAGPITAHLREELGMNERQIRQAASDVGVISERKPEFQGGTTYRLPLRPSEKFIRTSRNGRNGNDDTAAKAANPASSSESVR